MHIGQVWSALHAVNVLVYGNENATTARTAADVLIYEIARVSPSLFDSGPASPSVSQSAAAESSSHIEVASLAIGRALLQIDGENPSDTNGAVVVRYQMGLRDSCRLRTRTATLDGSSATAGAPLPSVQRFADSTSGFRHAAYQSSGTTQSFSSSLTVSDVPGGLPSAAARRTRRLRVRSLQQVALRSASDSSFTEPVAQTASAQSVRGVLAPVGRTQALIGLPENLRNFDSEAILARTDADHAFRFALGSAKVELYARRRQLRRQALMALSHDRDAAAPASSASSPAVDAVLLSQSGVTDADLEAAAARGLLRKNGGRWLYALHEADVPRALAELQSDCALRGAAVSMLAHLMQQPAFEVLRTQQQLGYIVALNEEAIDTRVFGAGARNVSALLPLAPSVAGSGGTHELALVPRAVYGDIMQSLVFIIQGTAAPPQDMDTAAAAFVEGFGGTLSDLDLGSWRSAVAGVQAAMRRTPLSMPMAFAREWDEISGRSFLFGRRVAESAALSRVRLEHVVALYRDELIARPRRLAVEVFARGQQQAAPEGGAAPNRTVQLPLVG
jgi:hypothetical protein